MLYYRRKHVSNFLETEQEFIERFDNFAFDEVINQLGQGLDDRTRFMAILAALPGCRGIDEFRCMVPAALSLKDGELKGDARLMAEWMADGARAVDKYPVGYTKTTDVAKQEQNADARPALKTHIGGFDEYSTLYLTSCSPTGGRSCPWRSTAFLTSTISQARRSASPSLTRAAFRRTAGTIQGRSPTRP